MPNKKPVPGYIWLLAGLAIGLFAAFLVYLDKQPGEQITFTDAVKQELKSAREHKLQEENNLRKNPDRKAETKNTKPRFEFYTILSELEVFVPQPDMDTKDTIKKSPSSTQQQPANNTGKRYLLQAGSFRSNEDAERLKASLALLGVQSSIQSVNINDDNWHRVRIGPFSNPNLLRETLSTLEQNNIHAMTMELK